MSKSVGFSSMLTSRYHSLTCCIYKSVQVMGLITLLSGSKLVDSLINSSKLNCSSILLVRFMVTNLKNQMGLFLMGC